VLIEQAIFTSADTGRAQGYQLVSRSRGVSEDEARELSVWGPSHDSLNEGRGEPTSINFHQLQSGVYAVSRTTLAGAEYSGRGGARVYTLFLLVPPEHLARFANNPFAVIRAATANGALEVCDSIPESLPPLRLSGRAPATDAGLLAQLACRPGPAAMATLLQSALSCDQLGIASGVTAEALLAGVINLLPVECRAEFSFSTGLKFSPSRPFRVFALPADPAAWRSIGRYGVTLLNLNDVAATDEVCWEGWPGCAARFLKTGRLSLLATELERPRAWLNLASLDTFAEQMHATLEPAAASPGNAAHVQPVDAQPDAAAPARETDGSRQRADGAHPRFESTVATLASEARPDVALLLAATLEGQPPEVIELFERIDDLVFTAIGGDHQALAELQVLWPTVAIDLDPDLVELSREQYLRCALSIWSECIDDQATRPERAVSAIDVLCVLFEE
jgi:hypothetical protein